MQNSWHRKFLRRVINQVLTLASVDAIETRIFLSKNPEELTNEVDAYDNHKTARQAKDSMDDNAKLKTPT